MTELTRDQMLALDAAGGVPPRVLLTETGDIAVLLRAADYDWARSKLPDLPDAARRVDPRDGQQYALVSPDEYERFRAFFEDSMPITEEHRALLRRAGERAGWDDPEMNVYDEPPRKQA